MELNEKIHFSFFSLPICGIDTFDSFVYLMDPRKEDYRQYLDSSSAMQAIREALNALYEEAEQPADPLNYIREQLGAKSGVDVDALVKENQELRAKIEELHKTISDLEAQIPPDPPEVPTKGK